MTYNNKYLKTGLTLCGISILGNLFNVVAIILFLNDVCDLFPSPLCVLGASFILAIAGFIISVIGKTHDEANESKPAFITSSISVIFALATLALLILTLLIAAL